MFFNKRFIRIEHELKTLTETIKSLERYSISRQGFSFQSEMQQLEPDTDVPTTKDIAIGKVLKPEEFDNLKLNKKGKK